MSRRSLLSILLVLAVVAGVSGASASHLAGSAGVVTGFEVDGDFAFPSPPALPGETRDWVSLDEVAVRKDAPEAAGLDDGFVGGSKEEDQNTWTFGTGGIQSKNDLTRLYAAVDVTPVQSRLFLGFERVDASGNGSAHVDFELNRSSGTVVNAQGVPVPKRTAGDLLIVYDYPGGTSPVAIHVFQWSPNADNPATPSVNESLSGTWTPKPIPAGASHGDANGATITRPAAAPFGGGSVQARRFGEAALDLYAIIGASVVGCPSFATVSAKSRASGSSINSNLEDRIDPLALPVSGCATKTWQFRFGTAQSPQPPIAGTTVHAVYTVAGGEAREKQLTDPDGDGTFTAVDAEVPPGTLTYRFEVRSGGALVWRSDHDATTAGKQDGSETLAFRERRTNA